jgi:hypothetical protein
MREDAIDVEIIRRPDNGQRRMDKDSRVPDPLLPHVGTCELCDGPTFTLIVMASGTSNAEYACTSRVAIASNIRVTTERTAAFSRSSAVEVDCDWAAASPEHASSPTTTMVFMIRKV